MPQAIASYVQLFVAQHQAEEGDRITVKTAANLVRTMVYNNKDTMEAGIIVAGWDRVGGGQVRRGCEGYVHGGMGECSRGGGGVEMKRASRCLTAHLL